MGKVGYHFLISLFDIVLAGIVFVNYLIWSGAYVDIVGGTTAGYGNGLEGTYFGFQSIQLMLTSYGAICNKVYIFRIEKFPSYMSALVDALMLGLPSYVKSLSSLVNQGISFNLILTAFVEFFKLFLQPFYFLANLLLVLGCIVYYVMCLISVLFIAFAGGFNIPLGDTLNWQSVQSDYNAVINAVRYVHCV